MLILLGIGIGLVIGLAVNNKLDDEMLKNNQKSIDLMIKMEQNTEKLLNTIEVYRTCYEELEKAYNNCQEGITTTINENIKLKRRLANGN